MTIALIANDSRKELMADFCNAYSGILSQHKVIATASTANVVRMSTGLPVESVLAGKMGGSQQIASLIACGEVDLVLVFNDYSSEARVDDIGSIMRLCDMYMVPIATNIAAAEMMIRGVGLGDLDWRKIEMHEDSDTEAV